MLSFYLRIVKPHQTLLPCPNLPALNQLFVQRKVEAKVYKLFQYALLGEMSYKYTTAGMISPSSHHSIVIKLMDK